MNTIGAFSGHRHGYYVGPEILTHSRDSQGYVLNCPTNVTAAMKSCSPVAKVTSPCVVDGDAATNFEMCKDTTRSPVVHQVSGVCLEPREVGRGGLRRTEERFKRSSLLRASARHWHHQ